MNFNKNEINLLSQAQTIYNERLMKIYNKETTSILKVKEIIAPSLKKSKNEDKFISKLNRYEILEFYEKVPKDLQIDYKNPILFYEKTEFDEFSNFHPYNKRPIALKKKYIKMYTLVIDGEEWPHTEMYYQVQKFSKGPNTTQMSLDFSNILKILNTPSKVAQMAKQPKNPFRMRSKLNPGVDDRIMEDVVKKYNKNVAPMRSDWETIKYDVMRVAVFHKFTQNEYLKNMLLGTHDREIVEHGSDKIWGDGSKKESKTKGTKGKNWLGRILMETRYVLKNMF
jgi:ribA/ribD-fused uncharacterized protein